MRPNSLAARDAAHAFHPYTNLAAHDESTAHVMMQGEGVRLRDEEGHTFIDGMAGLWCAGLGFSEERLIEAATAQMRALPYSHVFAHRSHSPLVALSEKLAELAPRPGMRPFFCNSGSEAVDAAIQFVWYYNNALGRPEKKKIIGRNRAYHGVVIGAASLTALPYKQGGFDLPVNDRFLRVSCPSHYREGLEGEGEGEFCDRMIAEIEDLIAAEGPETVAAFIGEPLMGAGGVIVPPEGYWPRVEALCRRHDILLIADEVINGFGRLGTFWGCQHFGFTPDLITSAKQLSAAYLPIGATLVAGHVYDVLAQESAARGTFGIGMTYGGHPVCAAVALETIAIYEERDILGHVNAVAPHFQQRLRALGDHPLVGEARGAGLIGGVELVADKATRAQFPPDAKAAPKAYAAVMAHGALTRPLPGDALAYCPPLIIGEADIDLLFDAMEKGLDETAAALRSGA